MQKSIYSACDAGSAKQSIIRRWPLVLGIALLGLCRAGFPAVEPARSVQPGAGFEVVESLAALGDRSTGTPGIRAAADFIRQRFAFLGFEEIHTHTFTVPVRQRGQSRLSLPDRGVSLPIYPLNANAIAPEAVPPGSLEGPLIYVAAGELQRFNRQTVTGAIVLMEIESGKNWQNAANLGAKALIYVDRGNTPAMFLRDKQELSPVRFPRFWVDYAQLEAYIGAFENAPPRPAAPRVRVESDSRWVDAETENIYCLVPGSDPRLREELVMVEAFYDSTALVAGRSPGADEALSVAALLELARALKARPPSRSVVLVATGGHAQSLAGMRELFWSLRERSRDLRRMETALKGTVRNGRKIIRLLKDVDWDAPPQDPDTYQLVRDALNERIKNEVDLISRRLMGLRLRGGEEAAEQTIQSLAKQRLLLRKLGWRADLLNLDPTERRTLDDLVPLTIRDHQALMHAANAQLRRLKSTKNWRSMVKSLELTAVISLHLSSHGDGFGAFSQGWLYPLKSEINRVPIYSTVNEALDQAASRAGEILGLRDLYKDTLRPSQRRTWQSYFIDRPPLGGEVGALAGYLGLSLVTVNDARSWWGTPEDLPPAVDRDFAARQSAMVCGMIADLLEAPQLHSGDLPRNGFSTITGRANFLRHGELFADQPAPGSIILAFQGPGIYHAMVDAGGIFRLKGVSDKRNVLEKVILEGYRFDPVTGETLWAIDKPGTGKNAYRVKMQRNAMETDLVMFACKESTLFNLLEPRNFRYLTKIQLIDGRREASPLRYWYSRIDTRSSTLASLYAEPGTRLKLTLSDSVIQKKLILTHATDDRPAGVGYLVDEHPLLYLTEYKVARDMWSLLAPRIANLERHGIYNERIRKLQAEGIGALQAAEQALAAQAYDRYSEQAGRSWALADRVYDHVEKTQKDVLFGVLFYIALFVPFAFCAERLLFSYADIYKRIIAFVSILVLLIAVIYKVHPAFQLAYSPVVVILAFFIIGLSLMVTLIIFLRFEQEMVLLQSRAQHGESADISRWKALVAAFFLGVNNLRRRRLRTALTCTTLIILTFTIMSFTSVKTMRHLARILYQTGAPYQGVLMKNANWQDLPPESLEILTNTFRETGQAAPRVWLESEDRTRPVHIPVRYGERVTEAQAMVGLSPGEVAVTGIDRILTAGRWLRPTDRMAVLVPDRMAARLGIDSQQLHEVRVHLWGVPHTVVGLFSGAQLDAKVDLDGEPLTPAIFPSEVSVEMTEIEMEAVESGEDVRGFQSRYQHIAGEQTLIVPHTTLMAAGGRLKAVAVRPDPRTAVTDLARDLVDRFGLTLFSGEPDGTFLYNASDTLNYSGVPNILIPMVISVLIVLNTMIGSVYERKREIAIYTSVGLAPSHVSFLFIAEALAFAVLSVVLGYLLAQISASLFSGTALWAGITVNYSSLAGVAAMVLVILVVLVSVIYPSRVAAAIAIPDVKRSWTLPEARDNVLELSLPFLMKSKEHGSLGGFLYAFFQGHQDVSHGLFSCGAVAFDFMCPTHMAANESSSDCATGVCRYDACLRMHADVWLAPFDLGIMQQVDLIFCRALEEPGFLEIRVRLIRRAGEANAWKRINKAFLHELRKQILLWRSLELPSKRYYEDLLLAGHKETIRLDVARGHA